MYKKQISAWTRPSEYNRFIPAPATKTPTASGRDESHMTLCGRIEKRLAEIKARRERVGQCR